MSDSIRKDGTIDLQAIYEGAEREREAREKERQKIREAEQRKLIKEQEEAEAFMKAVSDSILRDNQEKIAKELKEEQELALQEIKKKIKKNNPSYIENEELEKEYQNMAKRLNE